MLVFLPRRRRPAHQDVRDADLLQPPDLRLVGGGRRAEADPRPAGPVPGHAAERGWIGRPLRGARGGGPRGAVPSSAAAPIVFSSVRRSTGKFPPLRAIASLRVGWLYQSCARFACYPAQPCRQPRLRCCARPRPAPTGPSCRGCLERHRHLRRRRRRRAADVSEAAVPRTPRAAPLRHGARPVRRHGPAERLLAGSRLRPRQEFPRLR